MWLLYLSSVCAMCGVGVCVRRVTGSVRSSGGDALMPRGVKVKGGVLYIALRIHIHEIQTPRRFSGARTVHTPGCAPLKRRRLGGIAQRARRVRLPRVYAPRSSPLGADTVGKSRNMSADMLFTPGLLALMPPTICCVRSQSARDLVTEISAVPRRHRCGVAQSPSSELATQACPSHEPAP